MTLDHSKRPFYFTVVFWGATHRGYFTDLLVASLLSPGNIPALDPERKSKFLIVTTRADWDALQSNHLYLELEKHVETVWFEMQMPKPEDSKMLVMSAGHKVLATRCHDDRAIGVFVTPDLILSDGSCVTLSRLANEGKKVVLAVAIRFQHEELLDDMQKEGFFKPGEVLDIPARPLCRLAIAHLHSETRRYEFDSPWLADSPISAYWHVPGGDGMVIHSFSWAPLVLNYACIANHDTSTFEKWTLDGDYVHRNVNDASDAYIVRDSDELMLVSFTREAELHFDLIPERTKQMPLLSPWFKTQLLRMLRDSPVMDDLKRQILPVGVALHWGEVNTPAWDAMRRRASAIVARASQPPGLLEWLALKSMRFINALEVASRDKHRLRELLRYWVTLVLGKIYPIVIKPLDALGLTKYVRGSVRRVLVLCFGEPPAPPQPVAAVPQESTPSH